MDSRCRPSPGGLHETEPAARFGTALASQHAPPPQCGACDEAACTARRWLRLPLCHAVRVAHTGWAALVRAGCGALGCVPIAHACDFRHPPPHPACSRAPANVSHPAPLAPTPSVPRRACRARAWAALAHDWAAGWSPTPFGLPPRRCCWSRGAGLAADPRGECLAWRCGPSLHHSRLFAHITHPAPHCLLSPHHTGSDSRQDGRPADVHAGHEPVGRPQHG